MALYTAVRCVCSWGGGEGGQACQSTRTVSWRACSLAVYSSAARPAQRPHVGAWLLLTRREPASSLAPPLLTHGCVALVQLVCDDIVVQAPLSALHGGRQLPADGQQGALAPRAGGRRRCVGRAAAPCIQAAVEAGRPAACMCGGQAAQGVRARWQRCCLASGHKHALLQDITHAAAARCPPCLT
jgi:hypothetical protein